MKAYIFIFLLWLGLSHSLAQETSPLLVSQKDSISRDSVQVQRNQKILEATAGENKMRQDTLADPKASVEDMKKHIKASDSISPIDLRKNRAKLLRQKRDSLNERIVKYVTPQRAAFLSALLPGLGQIYNKKKYWKIPIIYSVLYFLVYQAVDTNNKYEEFRYAYGRRRSGYKDDKFYGPLDKDGIPPEKPLIPDEALLRGLSTHKQDRDTWITAVVVAYAFNIIDANVDAHLKYYDMGINLTFSPFVKVRRRTLVSTIDSSTFGVSLNIDFR